ncbi:hypothetical protein [Paenibacillus rhizophilus]|uniref:hypothetical protein n=1 Tax=Paenibacillus rhizophilus TaxID=1850366 RepID=UPI00163AE5D7|nr:hypothetical protein [Paenibacillus rhizophilus]
MKKEINLYKIANEVVEVLSKHEVPINFIENVFEAVQETVQCQKVVGPSEME